MERSKAAVKISNADLYSEKKPKVQVQEGEKKRVILF